MPVLSRLSSATGFKEVRPAVKVHVLVSDPDAGVPAIVGKAHSAKLFALLPHVHGIANRVRSAKVAPSVVARVVIYVIDNVWWLLSGHQKPSNAVSKVSSVFMAEPAVSKLCKATSDLSCLGLALADNPKKITRIRAILKDIFDGFGYKFRSHIALLCGLVRGLTVSAVSTPILSRGISL